MRIAVGQSRPLGVQNSHHVERRRLPDVVDVALIGDAGDQDVRPVQRFSLHVERIGDLGDHRVRHRGVDVSGELDEPGLESLLLGFPRKIERVDRDAVAAQPGARVEGHEAERLGFRGVDDFPDVDAERVAHQRDLVDEPDVDRAERVLEQLHHLGDTRRADGDDRVDRRPVERGSQRAADGRGPADDLWHIASIERAVARVDPLGRKGKEEIDPCLEPALFEERLHDLLRGARIGRRFEHDEQSWMQVRRDRFDCRDDIGQVGILRLAERRRHADVDRVEARNDREVRGRRQPAGGSQLGHRRRRDVGNVRRAAADRGDFSIVEIDPGRREAALRQLDRQRQADIPEADDAYAGLARSQAFQETGRWNGHGFRGRQFDPVSGATGRPPRGA